MTYSKYILIWIGFSALFSCEQPKNPRPDLSKFKDKPSVPQDAGMQVSILPSLPVFNEKTNEPTTKIFLTAPDFPELIYLLSDHTCESMTVEEIRAAKIPLDAKFLFKSKFNEAKAYYYGLIENNIVSLYAQVQYKIGPEQQGQTSSFKLVQQVDLNKRNPLDGFFICYDEDLKKELKMSIYFDAQGLANSIKFENSNGWIPLQYNTSELVVDGAMPKTTDQYFSIVDGGKTGLLNLTHAGDWDYAVYTKTIDGKNVNFTINHEESMIDEEYRKDSCY